MEPESQIKSKEYLLHKIKELEDLKQKERELDNEHIELQNQNSELNNQLKKLEKRRAIENSGFLKKLNSMRMSDGIKNSFEETKNSNPTEYATLLHEEIKMFAIKSKEIQEQVSIMSYDEIKQRKKELLELSVKLDEEDAKKEEAFEIKMKQLHEKTRHCQDVIDTIARFKETSKALPTLNNKEIEKERHQFEFLEHQAPNSSENEAEASTSNENDNDEVIFNDVEETNNSKSDVESTLFQQDEY